MERYTRKASSLKTLTERNGFPSVAKANKTVQVLETFDIRKGPYVQIYGQESCRKVIVINAREEEFTVKSEKPKVHVLPITEPDFGIKPSKRVGYMSTLSSSYDIHKHDAHWLCIFCHLGSHQRGLGDLFGPYFIPTSLAEMERKNFQECSQEASLKSASKKIKRARSSPTQCSRSPAEKGSEYEVWFHEECVVWTTGVYLIGERLQGLQEALLDATSNVCSKCHLTTANIGCSHHGCSEKYHYSCAVEAGCLFSEKTFSVTCSQH